MKGHCSSPRRLLPRLQVCLGVLVATELSPLARDGPPAQEYELHGENTDRPGSVAHLDRITRAKISHSIKKIVSISIWIATCSHRAGKLSKRMAGAPSSSQESRKRTFRTQFCHFLSPTSHHQLLSLLRLLFLRQIGVVVDGCARERENADINDNSARIAMSWIEIED